MKPRLLPPTYNVSATCPTCRTITSFEQKQVVAVNKIHRNNDQQFNRIVYVLSQCACGRGGFASVSDNGAPVGAFLYDFYPFSIDSANIPAGVPADIQTEFREAEKCQGLGMNRAASALFRSVLEKTLKANGYTKGNDPSLRDLQKRIDAAAADGVITQARQRKAHDDIRALGNDVLHDDWRVVADDEVEDAHRYMQRILEDLYDDRPTVETILIAKGRLTPPTQAGTTPAVATPVAGTPAT
jgi:Domain of unknown function (DUF4145)